MTHHNTTTATNAEHTPETTQVTPSAGIKDTIITLSDAGAALLDATRDNIEVKTEYAHTSHEDGIVNKRVVVEFPASSTVEICDEWQCDGDSVERELSVTVHAVPIEYHIEGDYPALSTRTAGPLGDAAEQVSAVVSELEGEADEYQVIAADALAAYAPAETEAEVECALAA